MTSQPDNPTPRKRKQAKRKPNINFRPGAYEKLMEESIRKGQFSTTTKLIMRALWLLYHGPMNGGWSDRVVKRLDGLSQAFQAPVGDVVEMLLDAHVDSLSKVARKRRAEAEKEET